MKQVLTQRLQQRLTPQQILLMKLIQLPARELEARLKKEIEENPVLDDPSFSSDSDNSEETESDQDVGEEATEDLELDLYSGESDYSGDRAQSEQPQFFSLSVHESLQHSLVEQISMKISDEPDLSIALYLIGSLDDSGYLRRDTGSLVDDLAFTQNIFTTEEKVEELLKIIQQLDPPGIGSRNLRESLLNQLKRKNQRNLVIRNAVYIIDVLFDDFSHKRYDKIIEKINISETDLKAVLHEIRNLNPKPGEPQEDMEQLTAGIVPDFTINVLGEELELIYNGSPVPNLNINRTYLSMLENSDKGKSKKDKETIQFIKQKVDSAKWFIDAIQQREDTLTKTMKTIIDIQRDYFLHGNENYLKPMILKDVAEKIEMDISTVSRVVNSKYVQTPYGVFKLKMFFSESFTKESGEEVSTIEVKTLLGEIISKEDKQHPLKDDELTAILKEKGYPIARRTIAKYREQLNIPVARLRRTL